MKKSRKGKSEMANSPEEFASMFASNLMAMGEMFAPLREATQAYKQSYIDMGWSEAAAESAALQYHAVVCNGFMMQENNE